MTPQDFWTAVVETVSALGSEGAQVRFLAAAAERAASGLAWAAQEPSDPREVAEAKASLESAEAAVWTAAGEFSPATVPPEEPLVRALGRVREVPLAELRALRAKTGDALTRHGDSNSRGYSLRSSGEEFVLPAPVVMKILGLAGSQEILTWYTGSSRDGLLYGWAASLNLDAVRLLRMEKAAREGKAWGDCDAFEPMHPVVLQAWLDAHTPWCAPA